MIKFLWIKEWLFVITLPFINDQKAVCTLYYKLCHASIIRTYHGKNSTSMPIHVLMACSGSISVCLLVWCGRRCWWMLYAWLHAATDYPRSRSRGSDYEDIYSVQCCESLFVFRHTVQLLSIAGVSAFYCVNIRRIQFRIIVCMYVCHCMAMS
jgi:hypothetical protein